MPRLAKVHAPNTIESTSSSASLLANGQQQQPLIVAADNNGGGSTLDAEKEKVKIRQQGIASFLVIKLSSERMVLVLFWAWQYSCKVIQNLSLEDVLGTCGVLQVKLVTP